MNIFDAHISGSLSVSSSAEIQGDLRVLGIINATISGNTTSADTASFAPRYTLTSSFYAYSGTTNGRLTAIETSTASLNTFTSSTDGRLTSIEGVTGSISSLNTYTGSNNTVIGTLQTATSSLNTFTSSASDRLVALETSTGSINTYTSSNTTNINAIHTSTASLNTYTGSNNTVIGTLQTSTGSLNTYTSSNTTNINAIHTATASLNSFSSSAGGRLTSIEGVTGSIAALNTYTGSNNTAINALNSYTSSNTTNINAIHTATSSLNSYTSSNTTNINAIHTATSSLNSFTSSASGRLTALETASSSLNSYTSSNTTAINALNSFTTSFNTAFGLSGANVTVKGNLTVQGSTTQVDSTTVNIGDNIIQLNGTGATNAGIVVRDATSPTFTSGSFLWDSTNDKWVAGPLGSEDEVVLKTASQALTNKTISGGSNTLSNIGNSSLTNSSITIAGTSTSLGGSITAATILTSTGVWSGSAQLPAGVVSGSAQVIANLPSGTVSGSSQVLSGTGIWSGSAQLPSGVVSGSSQVLAGTTIHSGSFFNGISVVSGSAQISFNGITDKPALVSGSSQISLASTTGFGTYLNQAVLTTSTPTFDYVITSNNANGTNIRLGDDTWIGDINIANTFRVQGLQDATQGYIVFGNSNTTALGRSGTGALTYGGNTVYHAGNLTNLNQLTNGPGYITGINSSAVTTALGYTPYNATNPSGYISSYTETDTLSSVTARGATSSTQITLSGKLRMSSDLGIDAGNALYFGREESFGGSNTGGDDYGYITFDNNSTTYSDAGGTERSVLRIGTSNDGVGSVEDNLALESTANIYLNPAGVIYRGNKATRYTIWDSGNLTNLNQLTNGPGYITGISFANVSSKPTTISGYGITDAITTGNIGSQSVSYATTAGSLTSMNISQFTNNSGYLTSVTNISGTAGSETLATVTGRGASTSTAISINNTLTVTSGRLIVRTGGANTYGIVSGYDNSNHLMTFRADIAGATSSPTLTAGHQMCFVEYAEANDTTGWFFKSSSTGTYQEIARITRSTFNYNGYTVYHSGNIPTWNQNTTGTASNITAYTINQSVGTGNSPTFAGVSASQVAATSTADATGLSLRSTSEVLSGEGWCTALYCYNNNDGFLVVGRDASANARPVFHVGGFNNAGHGGWSDGDAMVTLVRMDGVKTTGSANSYRGLSNSSYYSNIVKTTSRTEFKDSQGAHYFNGTLTTGGNMTVGGTLTENSSIRYKKDVETISYGLDKVLQLRGVTYIKKENNVKEMGVIAEEIAEILPDVVLYDSEGKVDSVSYGRITAVLIEAIKDLKKEINELKNNG